MSLAKTQRLLALAEVDKRAAFFEQRDEETGVQQCAIGIERSVWDDLGRPDQITVTVEPGYTLNPKEPS